MNNKYKMYSIKQRKSFEIIVFSSVKVFYNDRYIIVFYLFNFLFFFLGINNILSNRLLCILHYMALRIMYEIITSRCGGCAHQ